MGGLDLLPPAKAAARRPKSNKNLILGCVALIMLVGGLYAFLGMEQDTVTSEAATKGHTPVRQLEAENSPPPPPPPDASPPPPPLPSHDVIALRLKGAGLPTTLRLRLLPEWSNSSVAFMKHAADVGCSGELYRSEKDFLVQGRINCAGGAIPKVVKGTCPPGVKVDASRQCPSHDPQCGCHGPIMSKGMVGWAGGSSVASVPKFTIPV